MGSSYAVFDLRACPHMHTLTHTCAARERRGGTSALAVIAEMINKGVRFNPEGFSASHTTRDKRKEEEGVRRPLPSRSGGKQGMSGGEEVGDRQG